MFIYSDLFGPLLAPLERRVDDTKQVEMNIAYWL